MTNLCPNCRKEFMGAGHIIFVPHKEVWCFTCWNKIEKELAKKPPIFVGTPGMVDKFIETKTKELEIEKEAKRKALQEQLEALE